MLVLKYRDIKLIRRRVEEENVLRGSFYPIPVRKPSDAIASLVAFDALNFIKHQPSYMHLCTN